MKVIQIPNPTRRLSAPIDWDGNCEILPIIDSDGIMYSYWKPTWKERIEILLGWTIRLSIVGSTHPPVALDINKDFK